MRLRPILAAGFGCFRVGVLWLFMAMLRWYFGGYLVVVSLVKTKGVWIKNSGDEGCHGLFFLGGNDGGRCEERGGSHGGCLVMEMVIGIFTKFQREVPKK